MRIINAGSLHFCICSWDPATHDPRVELGLWLPDSYPELKQAKLESWARSGTLPPPADWSRIMEVIKHISDSCGFRRHRIASEGEIW